MKQVICGICGAKRGEKALRCWQCKAYRCPACGHDGQLTSRSRGRTWLCALLWFPFLFPGMIYAVLHSGYRGICAQCGHTVMKRFSKDSPDPRAELVRMNNARAQALEAAEVRRAARRDWTLAQYAESISSKVTSTITNEDSGLERHQSYVRELGQEVNDRWGYKAMQEVWHDIYDEMGAGPCSDLTRIWDGVGRWRK